MTFFCKTYQKAPCIKYIVLLKHNFQLVLVTQNTKALLVTRFCFSVHEILCFIHDFIIRSTLYFGQ